MNLVISFDTSSLLKSQLYLNILAISNWKLKNVNDIIYHNVKRNQIPRNKSNKMSKTSWYKKIHIIEKNLRDNSSHSINYQKVLKSVYAHVGKDVESNLEMSSKVNHSIYWSIWPATPLLGIYPRKTCKYSRKYL